MADESWMLHEVMSVHGVQHALVLSADGLVKQHSNTLSQEGRQRSAAGCAGLGSMAQSVVAEFGADGDKPMPRQVMVEFDGGFLFIRGAGDGSHLAVVADLSVDPGVVAQQMQLQVLKIGEHNLATASRTAAEGAGT